MVKKNTKNINRNLKNLYANGTNIFECKECNAPRCIISYTCCVLNISLEKKQNTKLVEIAVNELKMLIINIPAEKLGKLSKGYRLRRWIALKML